MDECIRAVLTKCQFTGTADREVVKNQIGKQLQDKRLASEQELGRLVDQHSGDILNLLRTTGRLLEKLGLLRSHIKSYRESLVFTLLSIAKWPPVGVESCLIIKQEEATHELLSQVQYLASIPDQVKQHLVKKEYIDAVGGCLEALCQLEHGDKFGPMWKIGALGDVHRDLLTQRDDLIRQFTDRLCRRMFSSGQLNSSKDVIEDENNDTDPSDATLIQCLKLLCHVPTEAMEESFESILAEDAIKTAHDVLQLTVHPAISSAAQPKLESVFTFLLSAHYSTPRHWQEFCDIFLFHSQLIISQSEKLLCHFTTTQQANAEQISDAYAAKMWHKVRYHVDSLLDSTADTQPAIFLGTDLDVDYSQYFAKRSTLTQASDHLVDVKSAISSMLDASSNKASSD